MAVIGVQIWDIEFERDNWIKNAYKLEGAQQHVPAGAEVRVVSASVIAQLQAQGLQVRLYYIYIAKKTHTHPSIHPLKHTQTHIPCKLSSALHIQTHTRTGSWVKMLERNHMIFS